MHRAELCGRGRVCCVCERWARRRAKLDPVCSKEHGRNSLAPLSAQWSDGYLMDRIHCLWISVRGAAESAMETLHAMTGRQRAFDLSREEIWSEGWWCHTQGGSIPGRNAELPPWRAQSGITRFIARVLNPFDLLVRRDRQCPIVDGLQAIEVGFCLRRAYSHVPATAKCSPACMLLLRLRARASEDPLTACRMYCLACRAVVKGDSGHKYSAQSEHVT